MLEDVVSFTVDLLGPRRQVEDAPQLMQVGVLQSSNKWMDDDRCMLLKKIKLNQRSAIPKFI